MAASEMPWETAARTVRDCPGGRTEVEWREAVRDVEKSVNGRSEACPACGGVRTVHQRYVITETENWMPADAGLPRNRWARSAHSGTLAGARKLRRFFGSRSVIWIRVSQHDNSASYEQFEPKG